jgi:hypothetical protein
MPTMGMPLEGSYPRSDVFLITLFTYIIINSSANQNSLYNRRIKPEEMENDIHLVYCVV